MPSPSRDDLASAYFDQLLFDPYPVQEEALLAWFASNEGVLVCAPTGMGKTIIAEAALFEALHTGKTAYYTTPLIALTEQKFREMQDAAVRWGFSADDVGLVTGNRRVNPDATILVVVAEILLNRLLHTEAFDFSNVSAVVMDEFHSFNDPERGVVWELSLGMLPKHVRLLLLSATVGNTADFMFWLRRSHGRKLDLIQSTERKVPLHFHWVDNELLSEQLERMAEGESTPAAASSQAAGTDDPRRTPALVFCFNRSECWDVAEQLKGKSLVSSDQKKQLADALDQWDWKLGVGPKLKPILMRGVGVHHAGMLPKYRRRVEELFQAKLLSVCVCTETLAAGINLPARSVVLTSLVKGPPGKQKLIDPSSAHQMFGRAGRPQFDTEGHVYALAHEDDVKIARWKQQYDQIPETTKDPNLLAAKKRLKKKMPKRREGVQYWNEEQYRKLIESPPGKLASRGELPYRLLAYLLTLTPDAARLRAFVSNRLLDDKQLELARQQLNQMLITLWAGNYIDLQPLPPGDPQRSRLAVVLDEATLASRGRESPDGSGSPPAATPVEEFGTGLVDEGSIDERDESAEEDQSHPETDVSGSPESPQQLGTFGTLLQAAMSTSKPATSSAKLSTPAARSSRDASSGQHPGTDVPGSPVPEYKPDRAYPTETLADLLVFRSVHPLYGRFLIDVLGPASREERIQALESVLELSGSLLSQVRVPPPEALPPGPLARGWLDDEIIRRGLASADELYPKSFAEEDDPQKKFGGPQRRFAIPFAEKLRMLFQSEFPNAGNLRITPVWVVGDVLKFQGDFQKYVTSRDLTKQEGLIFRHLLRMILLCQEFTQLTPPQTRKEEWQAELNEIASICTAACRTIDPESTDKMLESLSESADVVAGEAIAQ
jgi:superfamily II DNA/RNA helicase